MSYDTCLIQFQVWSIFFEKRELIIVIQCSLCFGSQINFVFVKMCLHYRQNVSGNEYVTCLCLTSLTSLQSYNSQVQIVRDDKDPADEKLILTARIGATDT